MQKKGLLGPRVIRGVGNDEEADCGAYAGFWQYSDETANLLARQLLDGATAETKIAVVSAPSAFVAVKNILVSPRLFSYPSRPLSRYITGTIHIVDIG